MSELKVAEGISGMWFYHLSKHDHCLKALCGAKTMPTGVPKSSWGFRGHLNERYCKECERLAGQEQTP